MIGDKDAESRRAAVSFFARTGLPSLIFNGLRDSGGTGD